MAIDRARWEQLAARMRTRWPDQLSNIKSEAYFAALSDLGKGELEKGVDALIAGDSDELPSPDQLRAAATNEAPVPVGSAGAEAAEPEERRIAGIPASWLLSALVAVVVAAVIVIVFVVVFDDDSSTNTEPAAFEPVSVENRLLEWDWGSDQLTAANAQCEQERPEVIGCTVAFDNGREIEVSVTPGESEGELTVDVPEGAIPEAPAGRVPTLTQPSRAQQPPPETPSP